MFCGRVEFARGVWAGVELAACEGKHDGSISGIAYFKCPPGCGKFPDVLSAMTSAQNLSVFILN